jgi:hypothetical protein
MSIIKHLFLNKNINFVEHFVVYQFIFLIEFTKYNISLKKEIHICHQLLWRDLDRYINITPIKLIIILSNYMCMYRVYTQE